MKILKKRKKHNKPKTSHELTKIHTDKDGRNWYEFADKMAIPAKRAIAAEVATRFVDMNLTKGALKELIVQMKEHANKGNIVGCFNVLSEIEFRLDFIGEEETLIELASIYFLLEGEDADDVSETWKDKKKSIMKEDSETASFFLSRVYLITTNYSELSAADLEKYLNQNKEHADRIKRLLLANTSEDILKT
jgi:hypothetical protein